MKKEKRILPSRQYSKRSRFAEFWRRYAMNKGALVGTLIILGLAILAASADLIYDYDTDIVNYDLDARLVKPCAEHPFGTDDMGRDLFTRVVYGTKYSFSIGLAVAGIGFLFGVPLGALCAYFGGTFDLLVMRVWDVIGAIPTLLIGFLVVSAFGQNTVVLIIALSIHGIGTFCGNARTSVMMTRSSDYIESARAIGLKTWPLMLKHVIPNSLNLIMVRLTLHVGSAIISASSLSYLGLGVPQPSPEWGALLSAGRKLIRTHGYLTLFPGLAIMITVLALNLMGDGLRDVLDPKLKK